jgi:LmbE family N-acetylglucosaminyl deacetylase
MSRVLLVNAHTDDSEYGCGGTIARLLEQGHLVHYIAFSGSEESVPKGLPSDILRKEALESTKELGIPPANVSVLGFKTRYFMRDRQSILEEMVRMKREIEPDIVLAPSLGDSHQDHEVVAEEALRAFRQSSIWHFEIPYKSLVFNPTLYIELSEDQLTKKVRALQCYRSQLLRKGLNNGSAYFTHQYIKANALFRGQQIGGMYAESFEISRWILRNNVPI